MDVQDLKNPIRRIKNIYYQDGKKRTTYICDRCGADAVYGVQINKGLALCQKCKNKLAYEKHKCWYAKRKDEDPNFKPSVFHYIPLEELDKGRVYALYKAHRSQRWIADDMQARPEDIGIILDELFGKRGNNDNSL